MSWKDVSKASRKVMEELGDFSPEIIGNNIEIRGYLVDRDGSIEATYLKASDLRKIANACTEVAKWLDREVRRVGEGE